MFSFSWEKIKVGQSSSPSASLTHTIIYLLKETQRAVFFCKKIFSLLKQRKVRWDGDDDGLRVKEDTNKTDSVTTGFAYCIDNVKIIIMKKFIAKPVN